ncbi:MAG: hypothetical protein M1821_008611 [Bathelium mastoideum]|nr:MAG: hypothetical protein M1821_008611 [Bathelium mastoideum]
MLSLLGFNRAHGKTASTVELENTTYKSVKVPKNHEVFAIHEYQFRENALSSVVGFPLLVYPLRSPESMRTKVLPNSAALALNVNVDPEDEDMGTPHPLCYGNEGEQSSED